MDTIPPEGVHLLIHDLRGIFGLDWAADHVDRLRSLTILSITISGSYRVGMLLYAANLIGGQRMLRWGMGYTLKPKTKLDEEWMVEWIRPWSRRLLRGMDHFAGHHLQRIRSKLNRIHMPVSLIWGDQDDIFPLRHASRIKQVLPQARLHVIQSCGHWSHLDAPDEVAQIVEGFVSSAEHAEDRA
jgi:pimeloyl-ACP methyl ester carboxylesterase